MATKNENLAWAAGFFDGEGCTTIERVNGKRYYPSCVITQKDRRVLDKFNYCLGGIGKIYGPRYAKGRPNPLFVWQATSVRACTDTLYLIWPWLGEIKRDQAIGIFAKYYSQEPPQDSKYKKQDSCKNGHDLNDPMVVQNLKNGSRRCGICGRKRDYQYRLKRKENAAIKG